MQQPSPTRMEAFSDGVIAVIITIMVLELKVPAGSDTRGLLLLLPTLAAYLSSFLFVGVYWVNHHHLVDRLRHVNALILWMNLALLFALSLLPFFTNYLIEKHFGSLSVAVYALSLLFAALMFQGLSYSIRRALPPGAAEAPEPDTRQHRLEQAKGWFSFVMYIAAFFTAFVHSYVALGMLAIVTLIWIVPEFGTSRVQKIADHHHGRQTG